MTLQPRGSPLGARWVVVSGRNATAAAKLQVRASLRGLMNVVVTDRKFPEREDPYGDVVATNGGQISYHQAETEAETRAVCQDADVVLTFKSPLTAAVIEDLDRTDAIIRIGTGTDTINRKAATERGITVSNAPGYSKHEVASHAIVLMLAAARRIPEGDDAVRGSTGWGDRSTVKRMCDGTFGSVGLGRIARAAVQARWSDSLLVGNAPSTYTGIS
jgi:D-3-phosphoglycerate dehydrogenase